MNVYVTHQVDDDYTTREERRKKQRMKVANEYQLVPFFFSIVRSLLFKHIKFLSFTFILHIFVHTSTCLLRFVIIVFLFFGMTRNSATKANMTKMELKKLKSILPTLKQKPTSTPMEIVLETIRYIRQLEDQLIDRFQFDASNSTSQSSLSDVSTLSNDSSLLSISTPLQDIGNSN
ncbi:unnamed protein product [Rotaria magnacalcarata]|uniref:Uncharacterized protein n=2 Tax=Rotaria magnacalcarata TaxID=392030 RepID=A0A815VL87_9BILA|nr:unnamed protein product [Rotaria magnacalcarata]